MKSRVWTLFTLMIVLVVGLSSIWHFAKSRSSPPAPTTDMGTDTDAHSPKTPETAGLVELSVEKVEAADIQAAQVETRELQITRVVPGRIQYDDTRHIAVKAATDGALIDVKVKPGDPVTPGQILAVLSSPEVGTARADVLKGVNELKLAQNDLDWAQTTSEGLKTLVDAVHQRLSVDQIRNNLKDKSVGKSRETLLSAYSRYILAESLFKSVSGTAVNGALSGRQVAERQNEYESAEAALLAISEQETYDAKREIAQARNLVEVAQSKLKISQQHLITLLGYDDTEMASFETARLKNLSYVEVRAPFAGTIESKVYSNAERVRVGDTLFILADTRQMWVAADLREGEWSAMRLKSGDQVLVTTPALADRRLTASIYYIGREVSADTNSVPLVATIQNEDGLLRPGLFVRVEVPLSEKRSVLAVPDSAICEHEGRPFVFIDQGERRYLRVDVERGITSNSWIEIRSGLKGDEQVVTRGAFVLKSELLLEREE